MKRYFYASLFFMAVFVLTAGCTEVTIYISERGSDGGGSSQSGSGSLSLVTFHASVESRRMETRSMTPIAKDIKAQLFAYKAAGGQGANPMASGVYEASAPGMLSGMNGYRMYLTDGMYDFYGFSENMAYTPTAFTDGKSDPLFNGIDYLWWHGTNQEVSSSTLSVPIVFLHAATQVVFEVRAGNGITLDRLVAAHLTAPAQGARMELTTGVIPPATGYGSAQGDKMGVNGTLAQYIMLPLKTDAPMQASFTVLVNGEKTDRTYSTDVPLPDGELAAGNSYRFAVIIEANGVAFDSVNVTNWIDVDETGKPLYPDE